MVERKIGKRNLRLAAGFHSADPPQVLYRLSKSMVERTSGKCQGELRSMESFVARSAIAIQVTTIDVGSETWKIKMRVLIGRLFCYILRNWHACNTKHA